MKRERRGGRLRGRAGFRGALDGKGWELKRRGTYLSRGKVGTARAKGVGRRGVRRRKAGFAEGKRGASPASWRERAVCAKHSGGRWHLLAGAERLHVRELGCDGPGSCSRRIAKRGGTRTAAWPLRQPGYDFGCSEWSAVERAWTPFTARIMLRRHSLLSERRREGASKSRPNVNYLAATMELWLWPGGPRSDIGAWGERFGESDVMILRSISAKITCITGTGSVQPCAETSRSMLGLNGLHGLAQVRCRLLMYGIKR